MSIKICVIFFGDREDEMMTDASCVEIILYENNWLQFSNDASKSKPP